jgi:hypothetical protein
VVPVGEVLVHRLSSSRPNGVGVLSDLVRDIEQRDNDGNGADDLPDIRQVIEIHVSDPLAVVGQALLLPKQKVASPSRTGIMRLRYNSSLAFELTFVFPCRSCLRFCDGICRSRS